MWKQFLFICILDWQWSSSWAVFRCSKDSQVPPLERSLRLSLLNTMVILLDIILFLLIDWFNWKLLYLNPLCTKEKTGWMLLKQGQQSPKKLRLVLLLVEKLLEELLNFCLVLIFKRTSYFGSVFKGSLANWDKTQFLSLKSCFWLFKSYIEGPLVSVNQ